LNINNSSTAVIAVGDLHVNSTAALSPPIVNLDDGGTFRASRPQRAMWESWLDFWTEAGRLQADHKVGILNGDLGELDTKRRSNQLITTNKATIMHMLLDVLEPALDVLDAVYVIRGTMAHTGKSGWLEEAIANDITINVPSPTAVSWWHLRAMASGVRFDISHHASMGSLPWSERYAALKVATITRMRYFEMGQRPPNVIIRSHNHRYADSGNNYDDTYAFCLPCWSLLTEYAYRIGKENSIPDIGGMTFICDDGKFTNKKYIYKPTELRRIWSLMM